MNLNPFSPQGSDPFAKVSTSRDDIFSKANWPSGGGGGRPKQKPEAAPEPETEQEPLIPEKEVEEDSRPKTRLFNLRWLGESREFNETISISADADLPAACSHITRVEFKVVALTPDGKKENIDKQQGHIKDGTASAEITLYWPQYKKDGAPLSECDFQFTAKHRDSKEEVSLAFKVKGPKVPIGKVWVRLLDRLGCPIRNQACGLKGKSQTFPKKQTDGTGVVEWRELPLDEYQLELAVHSGAILQIVPWLEKDADLHDQRLKALPVDRGSGNPSSHLT